MKKKILMIAIMSFLVIGTLIGGLQFLGLALVVLLALILVAGCVVLYFLPSIIAYERGHASKDIILLIDFLLGWTFLGWVGCIVWALIDNDSSKTSNTTRNIEDKKYKDLERLMELKQKGILTEEEFEVEKAKILG